MAAATLIPTTAKTEREWLEQVHEAGRRDDATWRIYADWVEDQGRDDVSKAMRGIYPIKDGKETVHIETWGGFRIERRGCFNPAHVAAGHCSAAAYRGDNWKPVFCYRFASAAERENYIASFKLGELNKKSRREERAAEKREARASFVNPAKVGDIYYTSWGYEQTNIDWFQVTKVTAKGVQLRPICGTRTDTGWAQGTTLPLPGKFAGPARTVLFQIYRDGSAYLPAEHGSYYPHDGSPKSWSSYG